MWNMSIQYMVQGFEPMTFKLRVLSCPNRPYLSAIFVNVSKSLIFQVKSFWATFIDIWRLFTGHTGLTHFLLLLIFPLQRAKTSEAGSHSSGQIPEREFEILRTLPWCLNIPSLRTKFVDWDVCFFNYGISQPLVGFFLIGCCKSCDYFLLAEPFKVSFYYHLSHK